jgi:hypothetical protein
LGDSNLRPGSYRGPFTFVGELLLATVTAGFDEALGVLTGVVAAGVPVGWIAYFVATG